MNTIIRPVAIATALSLSACSAYTLVDSQTYDKTDLEENSTFRIYYPTSGADLPPGMEMITYYNIAAAVREQMMERGFRESAESPVVVNLAITVKKELSTAPLSSVIPPVPPAGIPLGGSGPIIVPRPVPPAPRPGPAAPGDDPQPQFQAQSQNYTTTSVRTPHFYSPIGISPAPLAQPYFMYPRFNYWDNAAFSNAQVITGIYREGVLTMDIFNIETKTPLFSASVATILDSGDSQFRNLKEIAQAVTTLFSKFPVPAPKHHDK